MVGKRSCRQPPLLPEPVGEPNTGHWAAEGGAEVVVLADRAMDVPALFPVLEPFDDLTVPRQ